MTLPVGAESIFVLNSYGEAINKGEVQILRERDDPKAVQRLFLHYLLQGTTGNSCVPSLIIYNVI